jgi:hypothetical protein
VAIFIINPFLKIFQNKRGYLVLPIVGSVMVFASAFVGIFLFMLSFMLSSYDGKEGVMLSELLVKLGNKDVVGV